MHGHRMTGPRGSVMSFLKLTHYPIAARARRKADVLPVHSVTAVENLSMRWAKDVDPGCEVFIVPHGSSKKDATPWRSSRPWIREGKEEGPPLWGVGWVGNRPVPSEGQWRAPGSFLIYLCEQSQRIRPKMLPYRIGPDLASRSPAPARRNRSPRCRLPLYDSGRFAACHASASSWSVRPTLARTLHSAA